MLQLTRWANDVSSRVDVYTCHVAHMCASVGTCVGVCVIWELKILCRIFAKPTYKLVNLCLFSLCGTTVFIYLITQVMWHANEHPINANKVV